MRALLRKCRGVLGIGVIWSVAWAAIFAGLALVVGVFDPDSIDPGEAYIRISGIGAFFGFVSGAAFAVLLSVADGRRLLRDLSPIRAALWGAFATAAFPLLTGVDDRMVFLVCPIGAVFAAASVAVARKAELGDGVKHPRL